MKNIFRIALLTLASSPFICSEKRIKIYRKLGMSIGEGTVIESGLQFSNPEKLENISIGNSCYINQNCYFDNNGGIIILDKVAIAPYVSICTTTHPTSYGDFNKRVQGKPLILPVRVCSGSWVGFASVLLPGSKVGSGCVVGANTLVLEGQFLQPNYLYAGIPAEFKKCLDS